MKIASNRGARQDGATLVVGLVLVLVLTVIGVTEMNTSTLEVAMAGANEYRQDAFEMAENGIDLALAQRSFSTAAPQTVDWLGDPDRDRRSVTTFVTATPVPDAAFSAGVTGAVQAFHFDVVSIGKAARNAVATHTQSFYVMGPGGG